MPESVPVPPPGVPASDVDDAGVDRAQIRAMLDLTPEQRLRVVEDYVESVRAIRRANEPR